MHPIAYAYSGQTGGASLPYFAGKQYGGGWLRALGRMAFPILRKAVGAAGNVAANTVQDMLNDTSSSSSRSGFKNALKRNAIREVVKLTGTTKRPSSSSSSINRANKRTALAKKPRRVLSKRQTIFSK